MTTSQTEPASACRSKLEMESINPFLPKEQETSSVSCFWNTETKLLNSFHFNGTNNFCFHTRNLKLQPHYAHDVGLTVGTKGLI